MGGGGGGDGRRKRCERGGWSGWVIPFLSSPTPTLQRLRGVTGGALVKKK